MEKNGYLNGLKARTATPSKVFQDPLTARLHPGDFSRYYSGGFGLNAFNDITLRMPLAQITRPAQTILAADANWHGGSTFDSALSDISGVLTLYPSTLCYGNAHYIFCDGHAQKLEARTPGAANSVPQGYLTNVFFRPVQYR